MSMRRKTPTVLARDQLCTACQENIMGHPVSSRPGFKRQLILLFENTGDLYL